MFSHRMEQLETEILRLKNSIREKDEEIDKLRLQISGKRICGNYCNKCECGYELPPIPHVFGTYYGCILDCKCKDFKKK